MKYKSDDVDIHDDYGVKETSHDSPANATSNKMTIRVMLAVGLTIAIMIASMFLVIADVAQNNIMAQVHKQAEVSYEHDLVTRQWNAQYGGVYVEKTEGVVSNPYLKDLGVNSDIVSIDNKTYTLKNPALMTREIGVIASDGEILDFHLTSLYFVNPDNAPDEFEKEALMSFEKGTKEASTIVTQNGSMVYHYIAPFYVNEGCFSCHKGYNVGDVRGGISIFVPMDEAYNAIQTTKKNLLVISILLIIGVELLIYFLIAKPIYNLRLEAMKIGRGDLKYRIPIRRNDEIGLLGSTFNRMAFNMAENIQDLHESEEKYSSIFMEALEGIVLTDVESGTIFDSNPEFERLMGRKLEDLKKMKIWELVPPEKFGSFKTNFDEIVRDDSICSQELNLQKPDGEFVPIELVSKSVLIHRNKYILSMVGDLTERKRAEKEQKEYAEDLERSNELKVLFVDIMRHDLLNPAGIVQGYTEILFDMEYDEKKIDFLQKIEKHNKKLIDLIETTARFAKLESVEELEFGAMDIAAMFKIVEDNLRPQIEDKHITLEFKAERTYSANVNPMFEEVFVNLLSNAIKYSPEKSKVIIDIIDADENWKVTVTDFGEGVLDEHKTMLFDRFQRVNKVAVKGSGLGLAIVKRIVELHGGEVGVEDNPGGVGSVFWVTVGKA